MAAARSRMSVITSSCLEHRWPRANKQHTIDRKTWLRAGSPPVEAGGAGYRAAIRHRTMSEQVNRARNVVHSAPTASKASSRMPWSGCSDAHDPHRHRKQVRMNEPWDGARPRYALPPGLPRSNATASAKASSAFTMPSGRWRSATTPVTGLASASEDDADDASVPARAPRAMSAAQASSNSR